MIKQLQKRFIIAAMSAVTILLLGIFASINIANAVTLHRQSDAVLSMLLEHEADPRPPLPTDKSPRTRGFLFPPVDENTRLSSVFFTVTVDNNGNIIRADASKIASVDEKEAVNIAEAVLLQNKSRGSVGDFKFDSTSAGNGLGRLYLFLDISEQAHAFVRLFVLSGILVLLCWAVSLMIAGILSRRAITPIARSIERQKHFITDAGHELKTPLAIISANTDAMELVSGQSKYSTNIRRQTERLSELMKRLLALSKIDEINILEAKEDICVSEILSAVVEDFSETAEAGKLVISHGIPENIRISANGDMIEMLFSILIDNAVKYAKHNTTIEINLTLEGKKAVLTVKNKVDTLPDCNPDKLFDRFFRNDKARTQSGGGYGIGLSSARQITELHGGKIFALYSGEDEIIFKVMLPANS